MKRLARTLLLDIRLQFRNGFYYASLFVVAVAGTLLRQVPSERLASLMGVILFGNLAVNTFYFVSGLVLLEKDEATLTALAVSPLRVSEYLASKLITLSGLSLVESSLILLIGYTQPMAAIPFAAGLVIASLIYTLFGLLAIVRYRSINEFLMPSVVFTGLLSLPVFPFLLKYNGWLAFLHPMQAPLLLLQSGFTPLPAWNLAYGLLYGLLWTGVLFWLCQRAFHTFVTGGAGMQA
jgi:fluoroquinolone transport system permease protein